MKIYLESTKKMLKKSLFSAKEILIKVENSDNNFEDGEEYILNSTLAEDMFPFYKQVQLMTKCVYDFVSKVTNIEKPLMKSENISWSDLIYEIDRCLDFLQFLDKSEIEKIQTMTINFSVFKNKLGEKEYNVVEYLSNYIIPNFYFHYSIMYAILRNLGFEIGKTDYLSI
jgi:uncharacterized protein